MLYPITRADSLPRHFSRWLLIFQRYNAIHCCFLLGTKFIERQRSVTIHSIFAADSERARIMPLYTFRQYCFRREKIYMNLFCALWHVDFDENCNDSERHYSAFNTGEFLQMEPASAKWTFRPSKLLEPSSSVQSVRIRPARAAQRVALKGSKCQMTEESFNRLIFVC